MSIDIVMATYNGEKYLPQQIDSLLAQDYKDWRLLIRDDGSKDKTTDIIHAYAARNPSRVVFFDNRNKNLGAKGNFGQLLSVANADYVMCCDQDDVWLPNKISLTLARMKEMEGKYGNIPLLVHTDSTICDAVLKIKDTSTEKYKKFRYEDPKFEQLLVQCVTQGCTLMANKKLIERADPIPVEARGHDMWLGLVASATGHIGYVTEPTMLYRRHSTNTSAFTNIGYWQDKVGSIDGIMKEFGVQANILLKRHGNELPDDRRETLENFVQLKDQSGLSKKIGLIAGGHLRQPYWQNASYIFLK